MKKTDQKTGKLSHLVLGDNRPFVLKAADFEKFPRKERKRFSGKESTPHFQTQVCLLARAVLSVEHR